MTPPDKPTVARKPRGRPRLPEDVPTSDAWQELADLFGLEERAPHEIWDRLQALMPDDPSQQMLTPEIREKHPNAYSCGEQGIRALLFRLADHARGKAVSGGRGSKGGRPTNLGFRMVLADLVDLVERYGYEQRNARVQRKATRVVADLIMLLDIVAPNGRTTIDWAPVFRLAPELEGPQRLAKLAKRIEELVRGL